MKPGQRKNLGLGHPPGEFKIAPLVVEIYTARCNTEGATGTVVLVCSDSSKTRVVAYCY